MVSGVEFLIAWRYLRARRREGFISVVAIFSFLGIMLGVGTLIVVTSVMNGFRADLFDRILGVTGHMRVLARDGIQDYGDLAQTLAAQPMVRTTTPLIERQILVSANQRSRGALLRGITAERFLERDHLAQSIGPDVDMANFDQQSDLLVGWRLARELGLQQGSSFTLISPEGQISPFGQLPLLKTYRVAGLFEVGQYQYDANFVFMPLKEAQTLLNLPDQVTRIEIDSIDAERAESFAATLRNFLQEGQVILTWQRVNGAFYEAIRVQKNVLVLILTMIVLVAGFNIISGQIMLVQDKTKSIAVLRGLGAQQGSILRIFFVTGAFIGVVGTGLGVLLGLLFAANIDRLRAWLETFLDQDLFNAEIYYLTQLPSKTDYNEVVVIVIAALLITFGAALYPAWRAARVDPVLILRYT